MIRGRNAKSGHNITNHSDRLDEKGCIPERKTDQSKVFRSEKRHSIARLRQKVMRPCPALVHFVCLTSEDQMAILWCAYLTWKESRLRNYFAFTFDWISDWPFEWQTAGACWSHETRPRDDGEGNDSHVALTHHYHEQYAHYSSYCSYDGQLEHEWHFLPYHNLRGIREPRYWHCDTDRIAK